MAQESKPEVTFRDVDLTKQSVVLEGPERIHVSAQVDVANGEHFKVYKDFSNLYESFLAGEKCSGDGNCLGSRADGSNEYVWKSYSEVNALALQFGSALVEKGFKSGEETFVGIYSINREEEIYGVLICRNVRSALDKWVITDIACCAYNIKSVPLYDTLGEESTKYIINLVGIPVVVCDNFKKVQRLLDQKPELDTLQLIIVMEDQIPEEIADAAEKANVELVTFTKMTILGKDHPREPTPGGSDDLFTICFTSGTTGDPKGVMLTHGNQLSMGEAVKTAGILINSSDRHLSYLPLAHTYERSNLWFILACGAQFGFYCGDAQKLVEDVATLKPSLFVVVPRVLNRIYDKISNGVNELNFVKKTLFDWAFSSKKNALLKSGEPTKDSIWDKLVFKKLQMILGGNVRFMMTGAAPVSAEVLTFMRTVFGVILVEGYGQTECTAGASITLGTDVSAGHVGPPLPSIMIKLVDVPEKEYYAKDDKGEVCFKGPTVFKGYYKKPELTAKALDEDGWLHSGDIGQWTENGTLKIIDRKKHIFKLAQGEYVAPEKLENTYVKCPLIAQVHIYGNSLQKSVVALVIPDGEELQKRASAKEWEGTLDELCKDEGVKAEVQKEMDAAAVNAKLLGYEKVKNIHIHPEMFTVENGFLTPSLKSKRTVIERTFKEQLDALYEDNCN